MLKYCTAAKLVVRGELLSHINQSTVCYNYYCTSPDQPVADSGWYAAFATFTVEGT